MQSPDKLQDNRPFALSSIPTHSEMIQQARHIEQTDDEDVRTARLGQLNDIARFALNDTVYVQSDFAYHCYPSGYTEEEKPQQYDGLFKGFMEFNRSDNDEDSDMSSVQSRTPITLELFTGIGFFDNGFTRGNFERNVYLPVSTVTGIESTDELLRLMSPKTERIDINDAFQQLQRIIKKGYLDIGSRPHYRDYERLAAVEPWDFRDPRIPLVDLRRLRVAGSVTHGDVATTGQHYQTLITPVHDFAFEGSYWAIGPNHRTKNRKPNFVFEVYETDDLNISLLSEQDPTHNKPLLYVPISSAVELDIQLAE